MIEKLTECIFTTIIGWSILLTKDDTNDVVYFIINIIDNLAVYLSIRNYTIKTKKDFDRIFYLKVCFGKFIINSVYNIIFKNMTNPVKLVIDHKMGFLGIFILLIFNEIPYKFQKFFYTGSCFAMNNLFSKKLNFGKNYQNFLSPIFFFNTYMKTHFAQYKSVHLYWIVDLCFLAKIYKKRIFYFIVYFFLIYSSVFIFEMFFENDFFKKWEIKGLIVSFFNIFHLNYQYLFHDDSVIFVKKTAEHHYEEILKEKKKRRELRLLRKKTIKNVKKKSGKKFR